jgi:uncharacterized protein (DUF4415 family)
MQPLAKAMKKWCVSHDRLPKAVTKKPLTLRLSPRVVDRFRAPGRRWQTRIDETPPYMKRKVT